MATATNSRSRVKPAAGSCRWLTKPNAEQAGGILAINGTAYEVLPLYDGTALVGYRLLKADGRMYDLPADLSRCDCPDATYRERECKHVKALRAALAALAK